MKCPTCGANTVVVETSEQAFGYIQHRVRACSNKHRFETSEVDASLANYLVKYAARPERIKALQAAAAMFGRNAKILARVRAGEKHESIGLAFGLSNNMITTIANRAGIYRRKRR